MHTIRTRWLKWTIAFYLVLVGASSSGGAQAPGSAVEAVGRLLANYGPGLVSGAIQDWIGEGTVTLFGVSGSKGTFPLTVLRKGNGQIQRIIRQGPTIQKQGSDGTAAWDSVDGFRTVAQGRTQLFLESQTTRSLLALLNYQGLGLTLNDLGTNGQSQVIEASDSRGRKTKYIVDLNASVITEVEFSTPAPAMTDKSVFSDFRRVQGILTPFKTVRFVDGIKVEEMQFTSVRYNVSVKDSDFKP
jgi:hypothetical protein